MTSNSVQNYISGVLENSPEGWLNITTHRLDIYNEELAKTEFLEQFDQLFATQDFSPKALQNLPTAYDYIRLGHPLSCVLEWTVARLHDLNPTNVISFASQTMPILAVLRKNLFLNKNTQIAYTGTLPAFFNAKIIQNIYGYHFTLTPVKSAEAIPAFNGSTIFVSQNNQIGKVEFNAAIDFYIGLYPGIGSILVAKDPADYIAEIQHVRRRETIAMTPANCLEALNALVKNKAVDQQENKVDAHKTAVKNTINQITGTTTKALVASSGLSIQYAILMGLIHEAAENHPEKAIKIIVPPNCYGGTNDQARRVAACLKNVDIVDLPVDGGNDMVQSINTVLATIANQDAIPYIIAEIPTNPRVEVPDLEQLKAVLSQPRKTAQGNIAIDPVFILDQTFCPNVQFLGQGKILSNVRTISFASGSKFPSGGKCTAGYCVGNSQTIQLIEKIEQHLTLCNNEATALQYQILAAQMPSMNQRIIEAYKNTRSFVNFIQLHLPSAKINFVSEELAGQGFMPSVFSLDLPTKGNTNEERETYKRKLNLKLINLMISKIPNQSKYCVSYGQLKGCYWTIPATSTQGTTKEGDKDYIARVALSPDLDLQLHKQVFLDFVKSI